MSVSPGDLMTTARNLAGSAAEADQRSAISRAYYAAFHATDSVLPEALVPNEHYGSSHEALISAVGEFGRSFSPGRTEAAQISRALPALKRMRVRADYQIKAEMAPEDVGLALNRAASILTLAADIERKKQAPSGD